MKTLIAVILSFFIVNCISAQVRLDSGLVAYFPFNNNANDASGNENHGTVVNVLPTTDRFGNENAAYEFDGESSYITIPNSESLQSLTTESTQAAWINLYSWSLVGASFGPVFMKSNSNENQFQYRLSVGADGINIAVNAWTNYVTITDTLEFEQWYFIAATWKDDTARIYNNGTFIGKGYLQGPAQADNYPLEIGRDTPGSAEIFHGKIDEARIYNRALNDAEIEALYLGNSGINENTQDMYPINLYPNPAGTYTSFSFYQPQQGHVTLKIFNSEGREILTIFSGNMDRGSHTLNLDCSKMPRGIYLVKLQSSKGLVTGKLVVN